jgi:hypothetical protein
VPAKVSRAQKAKPEAENIKTKVRSQNPAIMANDRRIFLEGSQKTRKNTWNRKR